MRQIVTISELVKAVYAARNQKKVSVHELEVEIATETCSLPEGEANTRYVDIVIEGKTYCVKNSDSGRACEELSCMGVHWSFK